MSDVKTSNDGYRYILVVLDCFSKYAWVRPQRTKDAKATTETMRAILSEAHPRKPQKLQTDKGKEFCNSTFMGMLRTKGIHFFTTNNEEIKAAMVERLNRTLKARIYRYFTFTKSERYLDVLPTIVASYNKSYHRTIGMAPSDVSRANTADIFDRVYGNDISRSIQKDKAAPKSISPDTTIRITRPVKAFTKGYEPRWTDELFKVANVVGKPPAPAKGPENLYKVSDLQGEPITGSFYRHEIQPVESQQAGKQFVIEKIIRRCGTGAKAEVLVKWKGLHRKYNEWIPSNSITTQ